MRINIYAVVMACLIEGCVSPFNFNIESPEPVLSVEGYISDISYNDFNDQPSDPIFFTVKLKWVGSVTNQRDMFVSNAEVNLVNDLGETWDYVEHDLGKYRLFYADFKAEIGREYKLTIELDNGEKYESDFEPMVTKSPRGVLKWEEVARDEYQYVLGENTIVNTRGLQFSMEMPSDDGIDPVTHVRWDFGITYGFIARLNPSSIDKYYKCWITDPFFYKDFVVSKYGATGVIKDLLYFNTATEKIHEGFSILFKQRTMNSGYYEFWNGVKAQEEQEGLFAPPPYNLISNMHSVGHDKEVFGYFGVVSEQYYRWIFSRDMVSYNIVYPESLKESCQIPLPPESCFDCTQLDLIEEMSNTPDKPWWWGN